MSAAATEFRVARNITVLSNFDLPPPLTIERQIHSSNLGAMQIHLLRCLFQLIFRKICKFWQFLFELLPAAFHAAHPDSIESHSLVYQTSESIGTALKHFTLRSARDDPEIQIHYLQTNRTLTTTHYWSLARYFTP